MTMETIRKTRGVPAKRGGRIIYTGDKSGQPKPGRITSAYGGYLRIVLDGETVAGHYHPTWELQYLDHGGNVVFCSRDRAFDESREQ